MVGVHNADRHERIHAGKYSFALYTFPPTGLRVFDVTVDVFAIWVCTPVINTVNIYKCSYHIII